MRLEVLDTENSRHFATPSQALFRGKPNLVPRALFLGSGGKHPGDEVAGNPVMLLQNVGCFLRVPKKLKTSIAKNSTR